MRLEGLVLIDEDELGSFVVDSDNLIVVEFNGGRWSADWVFRWAQQHGKSLTFVPTAP